MPARCHDDRPPLFARDSVRPENGRQRLPEPSLPPWLNCSTPPAPFYAPLFTPYRHMGGATILAHLLCMVEAPPVQAPQVEDWE